LPKPPVSESSPVEEVIVWLPVVAGLMLLFSAIIQFIY
jgi:hypothetical protein